MKVLIPVPHFGQYLNIQDPKWQYRSCGIASLAMILDYFDRPVDLDVLVEEGLKLDGYIDGVGWKHQVVCDLAQKYGFNSWRAEDEKLENLIHSVDEGFPVIISIYKHFNPKNGGHLAVLNGYYETKEGILGFYVNDPIGNPYKYKNRFIPLEKFNKGWKKRAIYIKVASK